MRVPYFRLVAWFNGIFFCKHREKFTLHSYWPVDPNRKVPGTHIALTFCIRCGKKFAHEAESVKTFDEYAEMQKIDNELGSNIPDETQIRMQMEVVGVRDDG